MKLTPELKAHRAYGYARRKVHEAKETLAYDRHAKKYGKLKNAQNVLSCGKFMLKAAIREAWQKRAACRAWVPLEERYCSNCRHMEAIVDVGTICEKCQHYTGIYYDPVNWEPRKEGE